MIYADPTTGDDSIGVEDLALNDADSFVDQPVTNRFWTVDAPAEVPANWAFVPEGLGIGDEFRVLFLTSATRDATSADIDDYNSFVQAAAAGGHAAVGGYSHGFFAVASTADVDARDNTATTYTSPDTGVPIYWLGGDKIADGYPDLLRRDLGTTRRIPPTSPARRLSGAQLLLRFGPGALTTEPSAPTTTSVLIRVVSARPASTAPQPGRYPSRPS